MAAPVAQMVPMNCAENPIFFNGTDIGDAFLTEHEHDTTHHHHHSNIKHPCANTTAHTNAAGQPTPYVVCRSCRLQASAHIAATAPHLVSDNVWPLCNVCADVEAQKPEPRPAVCICDKKWLCYACWHQELEFAAVRGEVEGNLHGNVMRTKPNGTLEWVCRCNRTVFPSTGMMKCAGCEFVEIGDWGVRVLVHRVLAYWKRLSWT